MSESIQKSIFCLIVCFLFDSVTMVEIYFNHQKGLNLKNVMIYYFNNNNNLNLTIFFFKDSVLPVYISSGFSWMISCKFIMKNVSNQIN